MSAAAGAKGDICAGAAGLGQVAGLVAGVGVEVLARPELGGIDEQREDHDVGACAALAQKGQVSLMQEAHGRDHADAQPVAAQVVGARAHGCGIADDLEGEA